MSNISQNNKRIAKNTILLYFRMMLIMAINLYTSRIVLNTLGVDDYGTYTAIGGIVMIFNIIRGSLSVATQRFITYAIGTNNFEHQNRVFSTSIFMHIALCVIILLLSETVGIWLLENKMVIPANREVAAMWVYQCSIISSLIMIMSIPYNAIIIAHEKMEAFAAISLIEVLLRLGSVYLLKFFTIDKLILYSLLMVAVELIIRTCYTQYCIRFFKETKIRLVKDFKLIKEIGRFSMWSIMGNASYILCTHGLNILLNIFFGQVANAARGISAQIQSVTTQFIINMQTAFNPQITKYFSVGDLYNMRRLVFTGTRLSFFLIYIISLPIIIECETILKLWLGVVPEYTITFTRIILLITWVNAISSPMDASVKATGKIKRYELVIGFITILTLPISYIFLKKGYPAFTIFTVQLTLEIIAQFFRVLITSRLILFSISDFINQVIIRCIIVIAISLPLPFFLHLNMERNISSFAIICITSVIISCITIYLLGLNRKERRYINNKVAQILLNKPFC